MWGQQGQQGGWGQQGQQGQQGWGQGQQGQQGWGQQGQQGGWGQPGQVQQGWGQQGQQQGGWGQPGQVQQGWGQQGQQQGGWGQQGQGGWGQQQQGFTQPGVINLGGGGLNNFVNRWGNNAGFQSMNGYVAVDYSGGWNPNQHDQLLRTNIDNVFQKYDHNFSGSLEGQQFFNAYRDLCLMMGICPPNDYQSVWNAALQSDSNRDNRTTKMEMFVLFKKIQGINSGYGF